MKEGGNISLNLTDLLQALFSDQVPSSKTFDKKAKKIIRSNYKLVSDKSKQLEALKMGNAMSERKDLSARSVFSALGAENVNNNLNGKGSGRQITNYYSGNDSQTSGKALKYRFS